MKTGAVVHGPVRADGCAICHGKGDAASAKALPADHPPVGVFGKSATPATVNETCVLCHDELKSRLRPAKHPHPVIADKGCVACHDPHHSPNRKLLKTADTAAACLSCHKKTKEQMNSGEHHHAGAFENGSCLNCHEPHGSGRKALLRKSPDELCLSCHAKKMPIWTAAGARRHGATASGRAAPQCIDCHQSHGSREHALLAGSFSERFHAPFERANAELCFRCHESALATEAQAVGTPSATGFRNGERNLHFAHMNRGKKSLTCRACHDPHASVNPALIHAALPYEGLSLPLQFEKSPNGGNCTTACHGRQGYDRLKEVANEKAR